MSSTASDQKVGDLRYPIGEFEFTGFAITGERDRYVDVLGAAPALFRKAVSGLSDNQLDTLYRPQGWTVRQVVHHIADSHMNSYIRFRLALTEDDPVVRPYAENLWAELPDAKGPLVETSLCLLDCLHKRWIALLRTLSPEQWQRTYRHIEYGSMSLERALAMYVWHSQHHLAHINNLRERMGW